MRLDAHRHLVLRDGERIALTAREFSLLEYLMLHETEICNREQLLEFAWVRQQPLTSRSSTDASSGYTRTSGRT